MDMLWMGTDWKCPYIAWWNEGKHHESLVHQVVSAWYLGLEGLIVQSMCPNCNLSCQKCNLTLAMSPTCHCALTDKEQNSSSVKTDTKCIPVHYTDSQGTFPCMPPWFLTHIDWRQQISADLNSSELSNLSMKHNEIDFLFKIFPVKIFHFSHGFLLANLIDEAA